VNATLARINRLRAMKATREKLRRERASRRAALQTVEATPSTETGPSALDFFDDPQGFCEAFLQIRIGRDVVPFRLWAKQGQLAKAVALYRRVCCRSGHKVGKTALAAALAIWWACTRPNARVILTAPTERQVQKALWYEVRRFYNNSPRLRAIMPEPALSPATGVRWVDGRELFGFTAKNADAVSGPGGPEVLVIIDEASGVPREVWEALQGVRAGGGKVLALGNPTQTVGWFFDAFNEKRTGWDHHNISSADTPNYIEDRIVIPGLADRDYVREVADDYGEDSPTYAVRVTGDFPKNVANAIIGLGLIELARREANLLEWGDVLELDGLTVDLGVDVARFGDDDSAVSARVGSQLFTPAWFEKTRAVKAVVNGYDSVKVAGLVVQCLSVLPHQGKRVRIKIDCTGGYGEPVAAMLRALIDTGNLPSTVEIYEINYSSESSNDEVFPVLRDELWFGARPWFKAGGAMYPDPKLESEMMAATYAPDLKGRNKVEPKKEIKKRLGRSPDRADAALLAIYEPGAPIGDMPPAGDEAEHGFFEGYSESSGFG
jgi:phage terminase large subunit